MKKNSRRQNRSSQSPKHGGNPVMMRATQERRRSNAAGFHVPDTSYRRRPKHQGKGWDQD